MARIHDNNRFTPANNYQNQKSAGLHSAGFGRASSFASDLEPMLPEGTAPWTNSKANGDMVAADTNSAFALPSTVDGVPIDPQTGIPENSFFGNQNASPTMAQPTTIIPLGNTNNTGMPTTASSFPTSNNPMINTVMQMMSMMQNMIAMMMQMLQGNSQNSGFNTVNTDGTMSTTTPDNTATTVGAANDGTNSNNPVADGTTGTTTPDNTVASGGTVDPNNPTGNQTGTATTGADGTNNSNGATNNAGCNNSSGSTGNTTGAVGTTTGTDGTTGTNGTNTSSGTATGADGTTTGSSSGSADGSNGSSNLTPEQQAQLKANPGAALNPHADINPNKNFHNETTTQRTADGLSDYDRAIIHLWGRQVISAGKQDGGILLNVEGDVGHQFTPEEHSVADQLISQDKAQYGGITGKSLDKAFFQIMQKMHPGVTIDTSKWLNTPVHYATGPVNFIADVNKLQQQTGLTQFDQGVLRLWGHDPIMNGGKIDGSVLAYTVGNPNALDNIANGGNTDKSENIDIDNIATGLLKADLTQDGVRNGDSLSYAFGKVLDKVYLGQNNDTMQNVQQNAETKAAAAGRTPTQIAGDVAKGMKQAATDTAQIIKDHPFLSASAVAAAAAAGTVCPFLGGLAIGGAGIAAGQKLLNNNSSSSTNNN